MNRHQIQLLLPILFGFFIMGFCDVVGISSSYVKQDFGLTETEANFLPSMVFIWFFAFSVPTGLLMNKIGRKNTVLVSMLFTFLAMLLPLIQYNYTICLTAFALLGIGNTILQVSLNPLLSNVVSEEKLTSSLTAGQFVKAISSFCGPIIAACATAWFGNWQYMFPLFAAITLISTVWLLLTPVPHEQAEQNVSSFKDCFGLLGNKTVLWLFLGIVFVVGVDVGMNTVTPKILMERCGMALSEAGYGTSLYFAFRTAGAFIGAIILARYASGKFFLYSIFIALAALIMLLFAQEKWLIWGLVSVIGFACANVFSILFSFALQTVPEKANGVSGLMIMGVAGGAIIPVFMGLATEAIGSQTGATLIIGLCMIYLLFCAFAFRKKH